MFSITCALSLLFSAAAARSQTPATAYIIRGHQAEARQLELKDRLDRFHEALSAHLRQDAPDLLAKIELPPPIAYGYQIVPRILPDAPPIAHGNPHVVSFSWPISEAQIARAMASLGQLESDLAKISARPPSGRRAPYETIVEGYRKVLESRRLVDADVDYNWLWQRQIASNRPLFDRLTTHLNAVNADLARSPSPQSASPLDAPLGSGVGIDPPVFARVDPPAGRLRVITVPLYTDILDPRLVEAFRHAIETYWHVTDGPDGKDEYRVRLAITSISPERLYCSSAVDASSVTAPAVVCAPPTRGAHIDLDAHIAHFPDGAAVLTTGAESLQVAAGRAIVLGPHDVAPRTLAHEFGHILGFPDAYLRGYKDLGPDGFAILELVPDYADIMSSPGAGSVLPRHFFALIASKQVQAFMRAGLDALYQEHDPNGAVARFRQVLSINPDHYGATLQLAKALDQAGDPSEALPLWHKMLTMAEAAGDAETLQTVRARLADVHP